MGQACDGTGAVIAVLAADTRHDIGASRGARHRLFSSPCGSGRCSAGPRGSGDGVPRRQCSPCAHSGAGASRCGSTGGHLGGRLCVPRRTSIGSDAPSGHL
eukprot:jgi/Tetstr1/446779/TSEL_034266.t1